MNPFARVMVEELRASCPLLLEHTVAVRKGAAASQLPPGPLGQLMESGHQFVRLAQPMIRALSETRTGSHSVREVPTPKRAYAPREPWKYVSYGNRKVPKSWLASDPYGAIDLQAPSWWISVLDQWLIEWNLRKRPLEEQIQEAKALRAGPSRYARADNEHMTGYLQRMHVLESSVSRLVRDLRNRYAVKPSARPPYPMPAGPDWARFLQLAKRQTLPNPGLSSILSALRSPDGSGLPLPFLYQRWCGLRLVQTLEAAGWIPHEDPTLKLLVGGHLSLHKESTQISLLIEARFTGDHSTCGLHARTYESTPDYVLVHSDSHSPVAFVLDPTMHTDADERRKKAKYLNDLSFAKPHTRFGLSFLQGPQCSWAAAPLTDAVCRIEDPTGRGDRGTVPMNPLDFKQEPLRAWVAEFEACLTS